MGQMASNLGNSNVVDPSQAKWGDLDNSERGARLMAGGAQGLSKGLQSMGQQPQQGSGQQFTPPPMPAQPQPQLPGMDSGIVTPGINGIPPRRPTMNPFYGGH